MKNLVNLNELDNGGLKRDFDRAMFAVNENIQDPSTSRKKARKVVITLVMSPDPDSPLTVTDYDVLPVLAKSGGGTTQIWFGGDEIEERDPATPPPVDSESEEGEDGEAA